MKDTMKIVPSILSDEVSVIEEQLAKLHSLSEDYQIDTVQMDIIDGEYADNITISPLDLNQFYFGDLQVDLHLMTIEPLDFVYEARELQDQIQFGIVLGQIEKMSSQEDFVSEVKKHNWKPGLCIDAYTPVESLSTAALEETQVLQIMGIRAGFQGQAFIEQTYKTIIEARERIAQVNPDIALYLDGGVKSEQLARLIELGVDAAVVGSVLWKATTVADGLDSLYEVIAEVESDEY